MELSGITVTINDRKLSFSTSILNSKIGNFPGNYTNGITRWCEEAQMNIVGMENRQHNDENENNDKDYNDILFKVTSDPIMKPKDEIPVAPKNMFLPSAAH